MLQSVHVHNTFLAVSSDFGGILMWREKGKRNTLLMCLAHFRAQSSKKWHCSAPPRAITDPLIAGRVPDNHNSDTERRKRGSSQHHIIPQLSLFWQSQPVLWGMPISPPQENPRDHKQRTNDSDEITLCHLQLDDRRQDNVTAASSLFYSTRIESSSSWLVQIFSFHYSG